jgi:hypothetical protein
VCAAEGVPGEAGVVHAADAWFDRSPRLLLGGVRGTAGPAPAGTPPAAAAARGWSVGIALTAAARGGRVREDETAAAPRPGASEKFVRAFGPRMCLAAASYARAASSAVSKVPSHSLAPRFGSLISAAQLLG